MRINDFCFKQYEHYKNNNQTSAPSFKGQLEDDFFEASYKNDKTTQLRTLSSIKFDVKCTDSKTDNNFLHIALMDGDKDIISKSFALLRNKKKEDRIIAIKQKNNEGLEPTNYTNDENIIQKLKNLIGQELPVVGNEISNQDLNQLNELLDDENIINTDETFGFFDKVDDASLDNQPSIKPVSDVILSFNFTEGTVGHNEAKQIINDRIITPYKNNKPILTNGFLIYGASGVGKTHLAKSLFNELGKEFTSVSSVADFEEKLQQAKETYKKSGKQEIIFIDRLDSLLPKLGNSYNDLGTNRLMQLIENSSSNGVILIGATDKMYSIEPNAIAPNRFDKHIELLPLKIEDREKLIKLHTSKANLTNEDIRNLANKTALFSPAAVVSIINDTIEKQPNSKLEDFEKNISAYAKNQKIDLTERGKTAIYDTFLIREAQKEYDPKSLSEVKGMDFAKNTLYNTIIASFDKERTKEYKENKISIPNGILLYGPPGCGKTFIVKAVSAEAKLPLYQIKMSDFGSKYVNETSNRLKQAFDQLRTKY